MTKEFVVDQLPASNEKENDSFLQRDKQVIMDIQPEEGGGEGGLSDHRLLL